VTQRATHEHGSVATQVADGVGSVTFGHPKGNSLPAGLLAELAARITELGQEPGARVIVLRSQGAGAFCAGASFVELSAIADLGSGARFFLGFANLINAMRECPKLILVRVHGKVVGGGVGMVAASDYALATPAAQVKLSELELGGAVQLPRQGRGRRRRDGRRARCNAVADRQRSRGGVARLRFVYGGVTHATGARSDDGRSYYPFDRAALVLPSRTPGSWPGIAKTSRSRSHHGQFRLPFAAAHRR